MDEYHRMIRDGYFSEDERFELLEGLIVEKMPRDPVHDAAVELALALLQALVPAGWRVRPQCAATTSDSEPEPDLAVVRGTPRDHRDHHPGPEDMALVVEVSNTTVHRDRNLKHRIYARAGVKVYWIVNVAERQVEVYTQPTGPALEPTYGHRTDYGVGATVPVFIGPSPVGEIAVNDLLP